MMLKRSVLILLAFSAATEALASNIPFHVKVYESYVPLHLANNLLRDNRPENEIYYERLFIDRKQQNGLDEYICEFAPVVLLPQEDEFPEQEPEADILAKATALIHQSFSHDSCVWAYDFRGWYWTYAFCFGDKVIQYHEGAPHAERPHRHFAVAPSTVFVLGRFTKVSFEKIEFKNQVSPRQYKAYLNHVGRSYRLLDEKSSPFSHHSSQRVILQMVTDGSLCDMTRQPRTLEMMYLCSETGGELTKIIDVQEIKTCHYKMALHVPALCTYEPFIPNKHVQDSLVDVVCQKIDHDSNEPVNPDSAFNDYLGVSILRDDEQFPVRADNRVSVAEQELQDLSGGFYFALNRYEFVSPSEYFNSRMVVLFNGAFKDLEDLNFQFGRVIFDSIGNVFLSPFSSHTKPQVLDWLHKFVLWFEIYDTAGEFLGLSRIENSATSRNPELYAQLVDPVDLMEQDGGEPYFARFDRPEFQAPSDLWNFEFFSPDPNTPYTRRKKTAYSRITKEDKLNNVHVEVLNTDPNELQPGPPVKDLPNEYTLEKHRREKLDEEKFEQEELGDSKSHDSRGNSHFVEMEQMNQVIMDYEEPRE